MRKYRYFGGLLQAQQNWLNRMAKRGFRLSSAGKLCYEFEACPPDSVQYQVEWVGTKSQHSARDYAAFLEDMGYKVFFKNINLNYSVGKVRFRPWAEPGGRIATNATTFNRELLIVEKQADGKPFELHTDPEDKIEYYKSLRAPWFTNALLFLLLGVLTKNTILALCTLLFLVPVLVYQLQIWKIKRETA